MGLDHTVLGDTALQAEARRPQQGSQFGTLFTQQPRSREQIVQDVASHIRQAWTEVAKAPLMDAERAVLLSLVEDLQTRILASEAYQGVSL